MKRDNVILQLVGPDGLSVDMLNSTHVVGGIGGFDQFANWLGIWLDRVKGGIAKLEQGSGAGSLGENVKSIPFKSETDGQEVPVLQLAGPQGVVKVFSGGTLKGDAIDGVSVAYISPAIQELWEALKECYLSKCSVGYERIKAAVSKLEGV